MFLDCLSSANWLCSALAAEESSEEFSLSTDRLTSNFFSLWNNATNTQTFMFLSPTSGGEAECRDSTLLVDCGGT